MRLSVVQVSAASFSAPTHPAAGGEPTTGARVYVVQGVRAAPGEPFIFPSLLPR